jgi:homoserine dehydrogenase
MTELRIGLAGLGTVGAEVARHLLNPSAELHKASAAKLVLRAVSARSATAERGFDMAGLDFETEASSLARRDDIDLVVELIGGADGPAEALVSAALEAGKPVVTANKALIARHGQRLAELAEARSVALCFEAAVAGGIPAIKLLGTGLAANQISRISGILNGTCNYILSEMAATGRDFSAVLAEAQEKGYAEADPSFDIDGIDAAHKLAILAAMAFGRQVDMQAIKIEGIRPISALDIQQAEKLGFVIRLLGVAARDQTPQVQPCLLSAESQLAKVSGALNAVEFDGVPVENIICIGPGAGAGPTASAVLADILDIAGGRTGPAFGRPAAQLQKGVASAAPQPPQAFYLRLEVADRPGVLSEITAILRDNGISVAAMLQQAAGEAGRASLVLTTHQTSGDAMQAACDRLAGLDVCSGRPLALAILNGDMMGQG